MIVIPLGTNGFFSTFGRQTMCFAIPLEKTLIILDAGTGMYRFAEPEGKALLEGVTDIHIYLSHYHLDHTMGFYAAFKCFTDKQVTVFSKTHKRVFEELITMEYTGVTYPVEYTQYKWNMIEKEQDMDHYHVQTRHQVHNGSGSLGFRFTFSDTTSVSYVTDTEPHEKSVEFCKGSDLLLHEHFLTGEKEYKQNPEKLDAQYAHGHTTTIGASRVAKQAGVKNLSLVHHYPFFSDTELDKQLATAKRIFPSTTLATDLTTIAF